VAGGGSTLASSSGDAAATATRSRDSRACAICIVNTYIIRSGDAAATRSRDSRAYILIYIIYCQHIHHTCIHIHHTCIHIHHTYIHIHHTYRRSGDSRACANSLSA
jgi:hypothetical protein